MASIINALVKLVTTELAAVLSRTSSSVSAAFDLSPYEGTVEVLLEAGAATAGTNPTLDVKLTHCATSGGAYTDVTSGAFTQVTTTAGHQALLFDKNALHQFVKLSWTIGGTSSPAFPFGASIKGMKKYN